MRKHYFKFSPWQALDDDFNITLGDWGAASWASKHLTERIQPLLLRSPEVLIKAPWDKTTDLWNLGAVILEVFCGARMFDGQASPDQPYRLRQHLAEMEAFFGPFPTVLLKKGNRKLVRALFYGDGTVKHADVGMRPDLDSEWFFPRLSGSGREEFVSFLRAMMRINPAERLTPAELLDLPWLDH